MSLSFVVSELQIYQNTPEIYWLSQYTQTLLYLLGWVQLTVNRVAFCWFLDPNIRGFYLFCNLYVTFVQICNIYVFDCLIHDICYYNVNFELMVADFLWNASYLYRIVFIDELFIANHGFFTSELELPG